MDRRYFISLGFGLFTLNGISLNAQTTPLFDTDYDGKPRSSPANGNTNGNWDIGAFEFQKTIQVIVPKTPTNVKVI